MRRLTLALLLTLGCSSDPSTGTPGTGGGAGQPASSTGGGGGSGTPSGTGGSSGTGGAPATGGTGGMAGMPGRAPDASRSADAPRSADAAAGPRDAGVLPDGRTPDGTPPAAVGNPFVYVSTGNFGGTNLNIYRLNMQTGELAMTGTAATGVGPTYAAFHPAGERIYVLNEGSSRIEAFTVNRQTGTLTKINDAASGGNGPAHLSVSGSGKWVFVANYGNGQIAVLPIAANGGVGAPVFTDRPVMNQAHFVTNDPSGRFVFLCAAGANDRVVQYTLNDVTGQLAPNTPPFVSGQMRSPRHMAFHPNGQFAYAIGEGGGNLLFLRFDGATGRLQTPGTVVQGGVDGTHVLVHPNGRLLYASFRGSNRIQVYTVAPDGNLQSIQEVTQGVSAPWDFTIEPTGNFLLVANNGNSTVRVFRIDQTSGMLTSVGNGVAVGNPHFVGVLP